MRSPATLTLALLAALALPAHAQLGNPGVTDPATAQARPGMPAAGETNVADRLFLKLAAMGNFGEAEAGRLAIARSSDPRVQAFARQMVEEHSATRGKLESLARERGLPAPAMPQPDQVEAKKRLESLSGTAFNTEYLAVQLADHQKTAHLLEWEINAGQDAAVQQLAKETLPVVLEHLRQVQALIAETSGAPPQGLAAASPARPANRR